MGNHYCILALLNQNTHGINNMTNQANKIVIWAQNQGSTAAAIEGLTSAINGNLEASVITELEAKRTEWLECHNKSVGL